MMIRILTVLSFAAILFFAETTYANNGIMVHGDFSEMRQTGTFLVTDVIDPLTIKLDDGRFVQLAGLDFPDFDHYSPGELSATAVKILTDFLKNQKVTLYQTSSPDQGRINHMGRSIAHIIRTDNDVWVQGLLLSLGVARVRTTALTPEMGTQMLSLENKARIEKSGMWDMEEYAVLTPEQATEKIGSYAIVEGRVKTALMRKNRLYLNFGNNWKDDFTVSFSATTLKKFAKQKIYPKNWSAETIRVRGWIESYNGPYIDIDHPERIELLSTPSEEESEDIQPPPPTDSILQKGSGLPDYNN